MLHARTVELSDTTRAVLLLCGHFGTGRTRPDTAPPLTSGEYTAFATFLRNAGLTPAHLTATSPPADVDGYARKKVDGERIRRLLARGIAMALAVERWSASGIWITGRGDADYPAAYRSRLGQRCPPLLYCAGPAPTSGAWLNSAGSPLHVYPGSRARGER